MRFSTLALAGAFVLMAGAARADDVMANTYGNTITTRNTADGQTGTLLFNADGTFTGSVTGADGNPIPYPGKWKVSGGNICLTPTLPPGTQNAPGPSCSPVVSHNVGDSWTVTNDQGATYEVSLSAGR
jgi:hypothetical protein